MSFTPYVLPSMASVIIILFLLVYVFFYRRRGAGAWQVIPILTGFAIWSFGYAMALMSTELDQKVFWFNLSQVGPDFTPILWLFLVIEHTGRRAWFQKKWLYAVFLFPAFTTVLMWTNDWHHLLRRSVKLGVTSYQTTYLAIERGPWFYVESAYGYIFILLSFFLLFRFLNMSSSKKQTLTVICSMFIPILSNLLDIFQINPLKPFGATSIAFSVTGVILAWGLFRQRFLDIAPIARNVVLEKIGDGVVVLDPQHRIVDVNPAAYPLFCFESGASAQLVGAKFEDVISLWPDWNQPFEIGSDTRQQLQLKVGGERRFYTVTSSLIAMTRQGPAGWVIIFNDITEVRQANERLQNQLDEINRLQEQLREKAIRDELTGCYNRRHLNEMLARESARAGRERKTIGLMMLDIDHFKSVNDTHGHISGDRILQGVGKHLQEWMRLEDTVYRYGGEEFLCVLPGISMQAIAERANSIRKKIAALQFDLAPDTVISVTVSIGVAIYPLHGEDISYVLKCADQSLYEAKHSGRNIVCLWRAESGDPPAGVSG